MNKKVGFSPSDLIFFNITMSIVILSMSFFMFYNYDYKHYLQKNINLLKQTINECKSLNNNNLNICIEEFTEIPLNKEKTSKMILKSNGYRIEILPNIYGNIKMYEDKINYEINLYSQIKNNLYTINYNSESNKISNIFLNNNIEIKNKWYDIFENQNFKITFIYILIFNILMIILIFIFKRKNKK